MFIKKSYLSLCKFTYNIDKKLASSCGCGLSFMPKNL